LAALSSDFLIAWFWSGDCIPSEQLRAMPVQCVEPGAATLAGHQRQQRDEDYNPQCKAIRKNLATWKIHRTYAQEKGRNPDAIKGHAPAQPSTRGSCFRGQAEVKHRAISRVPSPTKMAQPIDCAKFIRSARGAWGVRWKPAGHREMPVRRHGFRYPVPDRDTVGG
jgi:hypothetical protein